MNQQVKLSELQILDVSGHLTFFWNPSNREEVEHAEEHFQDYIDKGYKAFRVQGQDQQGSRMESFDPTAAKVMMVPQLRGG